MAASGQMMSQFQKHFNSEIEEVVDSRTITFAQLAEHFHLPINEVAKKLGVCLTVLKKVCRKQGIPRWPYRKLKSLDKSIEGLRNSAMNCPAEAHSIFLEIENLEKQKLEIRENPSILVKDAQTPESPPDRSPPPPHIGASYSQLPLHQSLARSEGRIPACRSEPPPKKKKEKRQQMSKISTNNDAHGGLFPPSSFCSPPSKPDEESETRGATSSFTFDQFHPSGGRSPTDFFLHDNASRISPSSDPFEPSPISPESPGSPSPSSTTNHTNHVANAGWLPSNTPQNTSLHKEGTHSSSPLPTNHSHTKLKNNINNTNSRSSGLPPTPNSGRTRKRDEIEGNISPFASPFSSFASPQLFGVSQPNSFHLGSSSSNSPHHCFSHQLPQLEQKLRETCLNSPITNPISNPTTATVGSVPHFSAAPGAGNPPITNPAFLPSFQELVSFQPLPTQPLPTQNFYRNQLGSVTPDIPRPSKRMRDNQGDLLTSQVADFHLPSLENFTPH